MSEGKPQLPPSPNDAGLGDPGRLDAGERIIRIRIDARPERLRLVRALVAEVAAASGCGARCAQDMVIAVDEACQNVIRHAYGGAPDGDIVIEIRRDEGRLTFCLVDYAPPVDVSRVQPRALDDLRPGGLGTHFISECMDEVGFLAPPPGAGNCLWMAKRIE